MIKLTDSGAGTGKSYTMRRRIEEIGKRGDVKILGVTFTNLAKDNMLRDIGDIPNVTISTIYHLTCKFVASQSEYSLARDLILDLKLKSLKTKYKVPGGWDQIDSNKLKEEFFLSHLDDIKFDSYSDFVTAYLKNLEDLIKLKEKDGKSANELIPFYYFEKWKLFQQYVSLNDTLFVYYFEDKTNWDLILIDECQDTNPLEFHTLFRREFCKDYMLFADSKQTLYKWRGANFNYIKSYVSKLPDYEEIYLTHNYRSSEKIVNVANKLSGRTDTVEKKDITSLVDIHKHEDWNMLIRNLYNIVIQKSKIGSVGILTKTNKEAFSVYEYFKGRGIEIGKKIKNVKDVSYNLMGAIDLYKLHHEPFKANHLFDILLNDVVLHSKKVKNINADDYLILSQSKIATSIIRAKSIKIIDVIRPVEYSVVFDFETNGLDTSSCEIVQIGAIKLDSNLNEVSRFNKVLKIKGTVGASADIHGFTDEFIKENAFDYEETLNEFLDYIKNCNCYAHNCSFDSEVLRTQYFTRTGNMDIESDLNIQFYCTLDLARYIYPKERKYKLEYLNDVLDLGCEPNHNAIFDVECTVCLLKNLLEKLPSKLSKLESYLKDNPTFLQCIDKARKMYNKSRDYSYRYFKNCYSVFATLESKFVNEDTSKNDAILLSYFVSNITEEENAGKTYCDIVNDIDSYNSKDFIESDNNIWTMTTHQSKGLEFDTVIGICSMNWWGNIDERKCLEYVMFTRAKSDFYLLSCKTYVKEKRAYDFPDSLIENAIKDTE